MSNKPMVLVEVSEEETKWLADLLHDVYFGCSAIKASTQDKEQLARLEAKQKMAAKLMNRFLDKAEEQGFGNL